MTESEKATAVERRASHESPKIFKPPKFSTFATCVDSIKEGIRKISGCKEVQVNVQEARENAVEETRRRARKIAVVAPAHPLEQSQGHAQRVTVHGGQILGVRRKDGAGRRGRGCVEDGRKSSFEMFLSTIPKLDPIDRTVGWVFTQPDEEVEEVRCDSYANLPPHGFIEPNPSHPLVFHSFSPPNNVGHPVYSRGYETSVSRCESDRGTGGRGTPPTREEGQPRLDELFRQLQLKRENEARRRLERVGNCTRTSLLNGDSSYVPGYPPGITPDLVPFLSYPHNQRHVPATIVHKNSSYYNQGTMPSGLKLPSQPPTSSLDYVCEWQGCRMRFLTSKDLLGHMEEEHIGRLPARVSGLRRRARGSNTLSCQWKGCTDACKVFSVRYKLLLHVQQAHCKERVGQQKNPGTNNAQPHSAESGTKPSPPTLPPPVVKALHYKVADSPPTRARKPPTRTRRTSIDNRMVGRKPFHPPSETIPELLIEAQPVVAKRRKQIHNPQQSLNYRPSGTPDR